MKRKMAEKELEIKNNSCVLHCDEVLETLLYLDAESEFLLETAQQIVNLAFRFRVEVTKIDLAELVTLVKQSKIKQRIRIYTDTYEEDIKTHYEHYMNLLVSDAAIVLYGCMCCDYSSKSM